MGLDVYIAEDESSFAPASDTPGIQFEDDGYFWYLGPLFEELRIETGQVIDLYGHASFSGSHLDLLADCVSKAQDQLREESDDNLDVYVGFQAQGPGGPKELYSMVDRFAFQEILTRLGDIVSNAQKTNRRVVFFGD